MGQPPPAKYLPQLDGLRAVAVLMVFAYHAFHAPYLWAGVDLFFILSGYLITNILLRDRERMSFGRMLGNFYIRRAERILPAYLAMLLLATWVFHIAWKPIWGYFAFFVQNVYAVRSTDPIYPLLPLWSLAVEQHFYLIWPVVVFFVPIRWLPRTMVALLIVSPIARVLCTNTFTAADALYYLTPFRLDAMAAGALAALLLPHCQPLKTVRTAQWTMALSVLALAVLSVEPWYRRGTRSAIFNGTAYSLNILILGGLFVWVVLSENTWLTRLLTLSALRGLGRISYMFYLLHNGALLLTQVHFRPLPAVAAAFAASVAVATLSWFAIEKPVLSLSASHRRAAPKTPVVSVLFKA